MKRFMTTTATALVLSTAGFGAAQAQGFVDYTYDSAVDLYASDLLGARIYATEAEVGDMIEPGMETEWDDLGEIDDMVVGKDGEIRAVILGVGGFLGIGERDVAVDMSELKVVRDGEGPTDYFLVVNAGRADIENAPEYVRDANMAGGTDMASGGTAAVVPVTTDGSASEATVAETDTAAISDSTQEVPITEDTVEGDVAMTEDTSGESTDIVKSETSAASELATNDVEAELAEDIAVAETEMSEPADTMVVATGDRPMLNRPTVEREGYVEVAMDELTADDIEGTTVYGANDENVGEVGELILSADGGTIERAVINVGGFLGLGEKHVAVPLDELQILRGEGDDVRVYIDSTEEALEAQPEYEG